MRNEKYHKRGGKIRRNRRVRNKTSFADRWQRVQQNVQYVYAQLLKIVRLIRHMAVTTLLAASHRLRLVPRARRLIVAIGRGFRKRIWPPVKASVISGGEALKRVARQKNRKAAGYAIIRFFRICVHQVAQTPFLARQFALFIAGKKGPRMKLIKTYFDPSAVRTENCELFSSHTRIVTGTYLITVIGAVFLVLGAIALFSDENRDSDESMNASDAAKITEDRVMAGQSTSVASTDGTADFFNPFYIFTSEEAVRVSAYPLADPPGIVVDVHGLKEPEASPEAMIGKDERVLKVRRLKTSKGLRYIIRTSQSMKRIKSQADGNVITVSPLS